MAKVVKKVVVVRGSSGLFWLGILNLLLALGAIGLFVFTAAGVGGASRSLQRRSAKKTVKTLADGPEKSDATREKRLKEYLAANPTTVLADPIKTFLSQASLVRAGSITPEMAAETWDATLPTFVGPSGKLGAADLVLPLRQLGAGAVSSPPVVDPGVNQPGAAGNVVYFPSSRGMTFWRR